MEAEANPQHESTYLLTENGKEVEVGVLAPKIVVRVEKHRGEIYVPFLDERTIDYIAALIIEMIEDGFDCIIMITGGRRKGKSTLGIQIALKVQEYADQKRAIWLERIKKGQIIITPQNAELTIKACLAPDYRFSKDNVAFRVEDFSNALDKNPYANILAGILPQAFLDEAGHGLYSKEWMALWQRNLVKCLEIIGMKNQICYFILPHMRKLTGDIRDEMAHIWIDVDTKYKHKRGYAELYMGQRNKFEQSIWWQPKCAFKFNELEGDFWAEYEKKKVAFVNEIAAEKLDHGHSSKDTQRLNRLIYNLHERGQMYKEIGGQIDMSESRTSERAKAYQSSAEASTNSIL